ncbi:MAG TPA: TIGR00366 family protein [Vicinamibacterales bacterium]|jgi:short-chain fatty acids transporter|nr:TIGR00366 family protein [Vicinamibacterales bacterium]
MSTARAIEAIAQRATAWTEKWMPDAFVFALAATFIVCAAAYAIDPEVRRAPLRLVDAWGNGFWMLIPFTLQMVMIIIGGYVLASSPPVYRLIGRLAALPKTPKAAVLLVALAAMLSSLVNWGFSLIFSAVLAREVARRVPGADYRALGASSFLGLGTVWAQGLSGSAALQMARASSMPPRLAQIVGEIPLTETIFRWQSLACVATEIGVVAMAMWICAPGEGRGRTARSLGVDLGSGEVARPAKPATPGERLEHSPVLLLPIALAGLVYLIRVASRASSASEALNTLDFNNVNLLFLMLGALLHWTPASLMRSMKEATPATWGVLLQFPFYAGIFGVMTATQLSERMAGVFVRASSTTLYPAMILIYSSVLGMFVPSGGAKWMIEAPYVLQSAQALHVSQGWMVIAYNLGEAIANLLQPFWMLPILALLGLKARDIMGYTYLIAVVLLPVALVLITVLRPSP